MFYSEAFNLLHHMIIFFSSIVVTAVVKAHRLSGQCDGL